ncbi:MAG: hypothetical protein ACYC1D_19205 [Acidimicrobiales bacterium]
MNPGGASIGTEISPTGVVLSSPAAFGIERSLYMLSYDPAGTSTCTGPCSAVWPPLLTRRPPRAMLGVDGSHLGMTRRADGTYQVTYFGHPLYFSAFDLGTGLPGGSTFGSEFVDNLAHGLWYTLTPGGTASAGPAAIGSETSASGHLLALQSPSAHTSATLYAFSGDTALAIHCVGTCAQFWPPVLTTAPPQAGSGVSQSGLGTIQRPDGTFQVTYEGHPLYSFSQALDSATTGNAITAFGGTWHVVATSGGSGV